MRLGVIDVGSNTVHLLVVDAHPGGHPTPDFSHKVELRLAEHLTETGDISQEGAQTLAGFVADCVEVAESRGATELLPFATSAIRDAGNTDEVLALVRDRSGVELDVLPGQEEARTTFLAARRWFGWSAGRLLTVVIGGGSLELAAGLDEQPDVAVSLPLGAGRLSRELAHDPPEPAETRALRKRVRSEVAAAQPALTKVGTPQLVAGTSKTVLELSGVEELAVCPWALREGLILRFLDGLGR
ncbi:exopolyphosphatase [Serinicoccus chungangensis]|uniref:Exopolyphosphatase n=1 Tax=Serinicoccus chungangensis TaxID=767452 RepID=A0A0W8I2N2_9MICO|nr:exopolyphosphatase [Serinicoccus chungangensis]KUG52006.1 exopolyphosphatase [Serinicoccus chungangensis]